MYLLIKTTRIDIISPEYNNRSVTEHIMFTYLGVLLILTFIVLAVQLKKFFIYSKQPKAEIPKKRPATAKNFDIVENKEKPILLSISSISLGR